ncbi:MAG: ferrous iron transport protein A [Eubacteriales bacterium]
MTLKDGILNKEYMISGINLSSAIKNRLQSLGLVKNTKVKIISNKLKGSMVIQVRGSRFALDNEITNKIKVKKLGLNFTEDKTSVQEEIA